MVVPHCGSKTINVRLTVSPDSKKPVKKQRLKSRRLFKNEDDEDGSGNGVYDTKSNNLTKSQLPESIQQQQQQQKQYQQSNPGNSYKNTILLL